jgi:hypothetical protein
MTSATRRHEYTGGKAQWLYLAFELGVDEWKLGFTMDLGTPPRVRVMPARDVGRLARELAAAKQWYGLPVTATLRSCYEAGRDGCWLHRYLTAAGIDGLDCLAVDSGGTAIGSDMPRESGMWYVYRQRALRSNSLRQRALGISKGSDAQGGDCVWSGQ